MTKNSIGLYKNKVTFKDSNESNISMAMNCQVKLMSFGYMLNSKAFSQLKSQGIYDIQEFYKDCIQFLYEMTGGVHKYTSLYGNFPLDILNKSDTLLFLEQILHYWGVKTFIDHSKPKIPAFEHVEYKMVEYCREEEFVDIYRVLASSGQSLTPIDIQILEWFGKNYKNLPQVTVPFKENLAVLAQLIPSFTVQNVVDVLRIAVGFSGGDVSLPPVPKKPKPGSKRKDLLAEREKFKFKLKDGEKLRVLELFENSNLDKGDLKQGSRYNRFIRLAEILQVQLYQKEFPKTYNAFYHLRNQKRKGKKEGLPIIRTWQSNVVSGFQDDFEAGLIKLAERPGEYFRKLDSLIRNNPSKLLSIRGMLQVVGLKASNKVLLETYIHFEGRTKLQTNRGVFLKGARQKTSLPDLQPLPVATVDLVQSTILYCIKQKMKDLPSIGKVYLDPKLKNIPLPTNMRSMSESLVPIIRGTRIPMGTTKKVIRPFIHWWDENGTEDLDLHGFLFGGQKVGHLGYNGSYKTEYGCFSGDVRHRQGACAEYVDINVDNAVKAGFKYYAMLVHNYSDKPLSSLSSVTGVMERDNAEANDTWLPDTIVNSMKLTSSSTYCLIGVYDLVKKEYIHLDMDWKEKGIFARSDSSEGIYNDLRCYLEPLKISVYDLLSWHTEMRGEQVNEEIAETHFLFKNFSTDYTKILHYLGV